jgi:hypothetical protein
MCVSDRAFADYQTQEEQRKLLQAYKRAGIKRFHYTNSGTLEYTHFNSGTLEYTHFKWFVSYYTFIVGYTTNDVTKDVYMHVNPFAFLKYQYKNSQTTNRQVNRWLAENGFEFTIQDIAHLYDNAIHGILSYPMTRVVDGITTYVLPRFNHCQAYLNKDGTQSHERAIDKVPYLAYTENQNSLYRVGWTINDGNTFGVKYD